MNSISVIGAGGHTRSALNLLKSKYKDSDILIYDNTYDPANDEFIMNIKLSGDISHIDKGSKIFLSVGDNTRREKLFDLYKDQILKDNLFHEISFCEKEIKFGISNQIYANSYINSDVKIGDNNIINSGAIIEHEVNIGNHNHIAVGAKICGRVTIGDRCMIGANSTIIDKVTICDDVIIGAGSVVIKDITTKGTYVGIPARRIK